MAISLVRWAMSKLVIGSSLTSTRMELSAEARGGAAADARTAASAIAQRRAVTLFFMAPAEPRRPMSLKNRRTDYAIDPPASSGRIGRKDDGKGRPAAGA